MPLRSCLLVFGYGPVTFLLIPYPPESSQHPYQTSPPNPCHNPSIRVSVSESEYPCISVRIRASVSQSVSCKRGPPRSKNAPRQGLAPAGASVVRCMPGVHRMVASHRASSVSTSKTVTCHKDGLHRISCQRQRPDQESTSTPYLTMSILANI
jgi:hypothetical protein